jgi:hypothetical protein
MRATLLFVCAVLLVPACGGDGGSPRIATSAGAGPSRPSPSVTPPSPTATPSASRSPSPQPTLQVQEDAPTVVDEPASVARIASGDLGPLAPPGAAVSFAEAMATPEDPLDQIAFAWRRGADPFTSEHGFIVWQRFADGPSWRAVYAFTDLPQAGVLGIALETGELTGDGLPEILTFEQMGGTGACGTWRVVSPSVGGAKEVLRRETCDTEIAIVHGGLQVRAAVYGPDDPHCCPGAFRITRLEWDGETFVRTERRLVDASG